MISMMRRLATLVFLVAAVPVGALALGVLIAGWTVVAVLAITPLVVPALVAFRTAVGATARLDALLSNALLGTSVEPPLASRGPRGYWRSGGNVLRDRTFWDQQAYLFTRMTLGFGLALAEWTLLAASLGSITLPIWYRWSHPELSDTWTVDTLGRALLGVPVGIAGLALAVGLLGPLARWSGSLVQALLGGGATREAAQGDIHRDRVLRTSMLAYLTINVPLILIWALTGAGYFWPEWILLPLALPLAALAVAFRTSGRARVAGLVGVFAVFFILSWALTGGGYFWPMWPIFGIALAVVAGAWIIRTQRISRLEETRAGAVEQQESELARIERDLHDGAQARLVALGMSLGLAEQKLATDPAAAQVLLADARRDTHEALEELRNLARGIHPPVLADRGLEAAIDALAHRTPLQVTVLVDVPHRPAQALETTAYFVVAEALANSGKHAGAERVDIDVHTQDGNLVVQVVDNGAGGADIEGSGLQGLVRRVEAVDGTLDVTSPPGGPTTVRAELPCGS
jgi:signal transduction histidine kinase